MLTRTMSIRETIAGRSRGRATVGINALPNIQRDDETGRPVDTDCRQIRARSHSKLDLKQQLSARTPRGTPTTPLGLSARSKDDDKHLKSTIPADESKTREMPAAVEDEGPELLRREIGEEGDEKTRRVIQARLIRPLNRHQELQEARLAATLPVRQVRRKKNRERGEPQSMTTWTRCRNSMRTA